MFASRKPRPWSTGWKTLSLLKLAILATVLWLIVVVPDQCAPVVRASEESLDATVAGRSARTSFIVLLKEFWTVGDVVDGRLAIIRPASAVASQASASGTFTTGKVVGDVNWNGRIDLADAITLLQYISGKIELTPEQRRIADLDKDGSPTETDVFTIRDAVTGTG